MNRASHQLVDRAFMIVSLILVILGVGTAFTLLGSPARQRQVSLDQERVQDLVNIARQLSFQIEATGGAGEQLPEQLPAYLNVDRDPVTDEPYEYQRLSDSTYELCATFTTDSREYARDEIWFGAQWQHPAGRHCYELAATSETPLYNSLPPVPTD